jgi:hypothetical protein
MSVWSQIARKAPTESWIIVGFCAGAYAFGCYTAFKKFRTIDAAYSPSARSAIRRQLESPFNEDTKTWST